MRIVWHYLIIYILLSTPLLSAGTLNIDSLAFQYQVIHPENKHPRTSQVISYMLSKTHYRHLDIDDSLSSKVFMEYINSLDNNRLYFLSEDINEFKEFRLKLDGALQEGNLSIAYNIYNTFQQRFKERHHYILNRLQEPFDFSKNDTYLVDRSKAPWADNPAELDSVWYKRLKNEALKMKLAGKEWEGIQETLLDRYNNFARRLEKTKSEDVFQLYMNALAECFDPHTAYMSPQTSDDFKIRMSHSLEGIGAALRTEDEYTKVMEIVPGGPADKSDLLHPNDRIVGVAQGEEGEMVDIIGWRIDDVVEKIRGPKGTKVRLKILPAAAAMDDPPETITLVRDKVKLADRAATSDTLQFNHHDQNFTIGLIHIPDFYFDYEAMRRGEKDFASTTNDVKRLLKELQSANVDGIVIDLRNNGGGFLNEAISLTGLFIPEGPVVQVRDSRGRIRTEDDDDPRVYYDGPLAVLVNRLSASASEIFAAAIKDYNRGIVIGAQTFGKGTVQNVVKLKRYFRNSDDKYGQVKLTVAKFYRVNGGSTQHIGVIPDIEIPTRYDVMEVGESSYDHALLWDEIKAASYEPYSKSLERLLPDIKKTHQARVNEDKEYQLLLDEIEYIEAQRNRKFVSLNYEKRKQERESRQERKDKLKKLREEKREQSGIEEDIDFFVEESAHVIGDMILLSQAKIGSTD